MGIPWGKKGEAHLPAKVASGQGSQHWGQKMLKDSWVPNQTLLKACYWNLEEGDLQGLLKPLKPTPAWDLTTYSFGSFSLCRCHPIFHQTKDAPALENVEGTMFQTFSVTPTAGSL